jgi:hypothetical protein
MTSEFDDGMQFTFSLDIDPVQSFVMLRSPKWKSVTEDKEYSIRLEIDDWYTLETGTGIKAGGGDRGVRFFITGAETREFPAKFAAGRALRAYVNGKIIGSYSLRNSGAATREIIRCLAHLKGRPVEDPFEQTI